MSGVGVASGSSNVSEANVAPTEGTVLDLAKTEDMVANAWAGGLRGKLVDRNIEFRHLGMNCNRSMQILRDIWWEAKIDLPVNVFYTAPTIRQMASAIQDGSAFVAPDLIRLRSGDDTAPIFLFPGGGGVLMELDDLVAELDWPGTVYGIAFSGLDGGPLHDRFEHEAARSLDIIRRVQKTGPYRLAGYSIGGITALETARLIRQGGEDGIFLGLLDTPQNDHSWPFRVWAGFILQRILRKLTRWRRQLRSGRPARPATLASHKRDIHRQRRGTQFEFRFRNPNNPEYPFYSPYWVSHHTPNYGRVGANACRMYGFYRPRLYDGQVFFFTSAGGDPLGCDPRSVWPRYLPRAEWIRVPGDHLSMLVGRNAARLAAELTDRIMRVSPP
jgi:thioesterase domain-containing protein